MQVTRVFTIADENLLGIGNQETSQMELNVFT